MPNTDRDYEININTKKKFNEVVCMLSTYKLDLTKFTAGMQ